MELGHVFNCPRHPKVYCLDEHGNTCVLCKEFYKRQEKEIQEEKRNTQEAIVAAALANRAENSLAGKSKWGNKLPKAGDVARSAANKAREASKVTEARQHQNNNMENACKGPKGAKPAILQATQDGTPNKALKAGKEKTNGKSKLRIQRDR